MQLWYVSGPDDQGTVIHKSVISPYSAALNLEDHVEGHICIHVSLCDEASVR